MSTHRPHEAIRITRGPYGDKVGTVLLRPVIDPNDDSVDVHGTDPELIRTLGTWLWDSEFEALLFEDVEWADVIYDGRTETEKTRYLIPGEVVPDTETASNPEPERSGITLTLSGLDVQDLRLAFLNLPTALVDKIDITVSN